MTQPAPAETHAPGTCQTCGQAVVAYAWAPRAEAVDTLDVFASPCGHEQPHPIDFELSAVFPQPTRMTAPDGMAEAVQNMLEHRTRSTAVDRTGWTDEQWIEDARKLMDDIDGSIQSLLNGHVLALLRAVDTNTRRPPIA